MAWNYVLPEGDRLEGCLSSQLSVKSCGLARSPVSICQICDTSPLRPRGLVWEVLICIQEAGLVQKVTAEQVPTLVGNDARSLHILQMHKSHSLMGISIITELLMRKIWSIC